MPTWPSAPMRRWSRWVVNPREEKAWTSTANSCRRTLGRFRRACGGRSGSPRTLLSLWTVGGRIEEDLSGIEEAVEVRAALARPRALSVEISEELDAYQQLHAR